jgi:hypothetical protein
VGSRQGFARKQTCLGKIAIDPPTTALGNLQLGERREEPRGRPALLIGTFSELWPQSGDRRQTKLMQQQRQPGGVDLDRAHDISLADDALSKAS